MSGTIDENENERVEGNPSFSSDPATIDVGADIASRGVRPETIQAIRSIIEMVDHDGPAERGSVSRLTQASVDYVRDTTAKLFRRLDEMREENKRRDRKFDQSDWVAYLNHPTTPPITTVIPVRVYIAELPRSDALRRIETAVGTVVRSLEFDISSEYPAEISSWFKSWWARAEKVTESEAFQERLGKVERALELEKIGKAQAEIDRSDAASVAELLEAVKDYDVVAMQLGSLVLAKFVRSGQKIVVSRKLSLRELQVLETNQNLLTDPTNLFDRLTGLVALDGRKGEGGQDDNIVPLPRNRNPPSQSG